MVGRGPCTEERQGNMRPRIMHPAAVREEKRLRQLPYAWKASTRVFKENWHVREYGNAHLHRCRGKGRDWPKGQTWSAGESGRCSHQRAKEVYQADTREDQEFSTDVPLLVVGWKGQGEGGGGYGRTPARGLLLPAEARADLTTLAAMTSGKAGLKVRQKAAWLWKTSDSRGCQSPARPRGGGKRGIGGVPA